MNHGLKMKNKHLARTLITWDTRHIPLPYPRVLTSWLVGWNGMTQLVLEVDGYLVLSAIGYYLLVGLKKVVDGLPLGLIVKSFPGR